MNWTCEQTELLLTDYLDDLLQPEERHAFDRHVNSCERCTPLVASVVHAITGLHALPELEVPPRLVYNILDATLGPRESVTGWAAFLAWIRSLASPRFAYGSVSVAATFAILLTASGFNWRKPKLADLSPATIARNTNNQAQRIYARGAKYVSDLRVVYEIESRLRQNDLPSSNESTLPENNPPKEPGRTDTTNPSTPRQQNRANDVNSHLQVLANELPVVSDRFCLSMSGKLMGLGR